MTEAEKRATKKYEATNVTRICLKLNKKTDADILKALDETDNKQGFIKGCIRKEINFRK